MKIATKSLGLVTLLMTAAVCADTQSDIKALQVKVEQAQEALKKEIETAKLDGQRASMRDKANNKGNVLQNEGSGIFNGLKEEFTAVLADARYQGQDQLKSTLKSDVIPWIEQEIQRMDKLASDYSSYPGFSDATTFINNYLKSFLTELQRIVQ